MTINVLVVDDSPFSRRALTKLLETAPEIKVIGTAYDGENAIKKVLSLRPDVITLDLEMPGMDGFAFLRWVMANRPVPVLVVSSRGDNRSVFQAMDLGAVDFLVKPAAKASSKLFDLHRDLLEKIRAIPKLNLGNVQRQRPVTAPAPVPAPGPAPANDLRAFDLVAVGSSTGGPPALQSIFSQAPPDLNTSFLIAQHMPPTFTRLFAERLDKHSALTVVEAEDGEPIRPGTAYIAPGGCQMRVQRGSREEMLHIQERTLHERYAPSVDVMFESVAETYGRHALAVILTGMGSDGTNGLRKIKERGGRTIAESEETAVIFGMPAEAIKQGQIDEVLPLPKIPRAIFSACKRRR